MSVVKINAITVPADRAAELERRFAARAGAVGEQAGFEAFELLRPTDGRDTYLVYTRWRSDDDFRAWVESPAFQHGHSAHSSEGPVSDQSELWAFDVVQHEEAAGELAGLRNFHGVFGYVAIVANGLAGLVCLAAWLLPRLRGRWVWVVTIAAEAAMMLQVVIGVVLVSSDEYAVARFHMFYGFVAFLTVGLAYQYRESFWTRPPIDAPRYRRREFLYFLVGLFIMGLGIRAVLQVTA